MFFNKSPQQQMQEQLVRVKFLTNSLNKSSNRSKLKEKQYQKKAKKALINNDEKTAQVYARQAVQHKNMALKLVTLACRMDMFETQVKSHVDANHMSGEIVNIIGGLTQLCNHEMTMSNITKFESMMDDATVATNYTSNVLDSTMVDGVSHVEEREMIEMMKDDINLDMRSELPMTLPPMAPFVSSNASKDLF